METNMTKVERLAMLAGLAEIQRTDDPSRYAAIHTIATAGGKHSPINAREIAVLKAKLSTKIHP